MKKLSKLFRPICRTKENDRQAKMHPTLNYLSMNKHKLSLGQLAEISHQLGEEVKRRRIARRPKTQVLRKYPEAVLHCNDYNLPVTYSIWSNEDGWDTNTKELSDRKLTPARAWADARDRLKKKK